MKFIWIKINIPWFGSVLNPTEQVWLKQKWIEKRQPFNMLELKICGQPKGDKCLCNFDWSHVRQDYKQE